MRFVVADKPACRRPGAHQRSGAVADKHPAVAQQRIEEGQKERRRHAVRGADAHHSLFDRRTRMRRDRRIVKPCALAFQGVEQLAMVGVVHHADNRFPVGDDSQRQAPGMQAVKKTAGAVDRIDNPQDVGVRHLRSALFAEKAVLREGVHNALLHKRFDLFIGDADHVLQVIAFMIHRQPVALLIEFERQFRAGLRQLAGQAVAGLQFM